MSRRRPHIANLEETEDFGSKSKAKKTIFSANPNVRFGEKIPTKSSEKVPTKTKTNDAKFDCFQDQSRLEVQEREEFVVKGNQWFRGLVVRGKGTKFGRLKFKQRLRVPGIGNKKTIFCKIRS